MALAALSPVLAAFESYPVFFQCFDILKLEFSIYDVLIPNWIDGTIDMHDIVILKASYDMNDGIDFPDIGQELIAESFTFAGSFY